MKTSGLNSSPDPNGSLGKRRVLYVVRDFPQISQTYLFSEMRAVARENELCIIAMNGANRPYANASEFHLADGMEAAIAIGREFNPDVVHAHYLHMASDAEALAEALGVGFTLRTHSFDTLPLRFDAKRFAKRILKRPDDLNTARSDLLAHIPALNSERCLGVLGFGYAKSLLRRHLNDPGKVHKAYSVIDFERFYDRGPNGDAVMNTGACLPKKNMEDFVDLASLVPGTEFNLYPLGYDRERLKAYNASKGSPVEIKPMVQPEDMPAEYKKHRWLVYTADAVAKTVGWPMAIAEAQASGVGVCIANIRPDLKDYVGTHAGILYNDIRELVGIVSGPVPEDMREAGFEQAKKSDVFRHLNVLTDLWPDRQRPGAIAA